MRQILYLALGIALWACGATAYKSPRLAGKLAGMSINDTSPEVVGGAAHYCYRKCVEGDTRVCNYSFTLTEYTTMAIACNDCPYNKDDCYKKGCITAGGEPREVTVVNHMLPGPSVQVCEGDTIRVNLSNNCASDSATIHWHGMYQPKTPYMDGVPYVTQCPVQPENTFLYNFEADPAGTHIWHSHIGLQEPDGFHGSVIVRKANDPLEKYYDFDLAEHVMVVWHWYGQPTSSITKSTFFRSVLAVGHSLTVNGFTSTANYTRDGVNYTTPKANFTVKQGYRYRFRTIGNVAIYCPVQISVDHHKLLVIATDGPPVEPVEVDSFIIGAGERYDVVVNANQSIGNYWIRFKGLGNCAQSGVFALANLHYENATDDEPSGVVTYGDTDRSGVLLNPVGEIEDYANNTLVTVADLKTTSQDAVDVSGKPDQIFYWTLGLNTYNDFQTPGPYAQIDSVSFDFPPIPFLTQYDDVTDDMFCAGNNTRNADCLGSYCNCPVIHDIKLGNLVEMVIIDNSTVAAVNHPIHMHGGHFRVVAMEYGNGSHTLDDIKARNENGSIEKAFYTAPLKDVIGVPSLGLAVMRFRADNPGYWFVHCHVGVHQEEGMAFILKVGEDSDMFHPPPDFPKCGDYAITSSSHKKTATENTCSLAQSDETSSASASAEASAEYTTRSSAEASASASAESSAEASTSASAETSSEASAKASASASAEASASASAETGSEASAESTSESRYVASDETTTKSSYEASAESSTSDSAETSKAKSHSSDAKARIAELKQKMEDKRAARRERHKHD